MGLAQEVLSGGVDVGQGAIAKLSGIMLLGGTVFKAVAKVNEGEMGVRTHYGRTHRIRDSRFFYHNKGDLYGIAGPGYHPVFPFTHSIKTISVRDRSNDLGELQVDREDSQFKVMSSITWNVMPDGDHPYRALYLIQNEGALTENVTNLCLAGLRDVMAAIPKSRLIDSGEVQGAVKEVCDKDLENYGVHLKRLSLLTVTPTIGEMLLRSGQTPRPPSVGIAAVAAELAPGLRAVE